MNELVIGDKTYISSKRAAEITGYAKDYVGQLCREGYVEAKMVGRSWYVLESSIREHRFGRQGEAEPVATPSSEEAPVAQKEETPADLGVTWTPPVYVPEKPTSIPTLTQSAAPKRSGEEVVRETAQSLDLSDSQTTLADMQSAWQEWYSTRQEPEEEEDPEVEDEEEIEQEEKEVEDLPDDAEAEPEEDSVSIPLIKVREQRVADITPVRREIEPEGVIRSMSAPRPPMPQKKSGANVVVMALLVAVAGLVIAIGVVGSGFGEAYVDNNIILRYLGGESTIYK